MKLLLLLSLPYLRRHKLRSLLTLMGISLGVAVFTGMHTANRTVQQAFQRTVDRIAGSAQLQVSAGETGFPEEILERVQSVGEVRAAAPVIEATLNTGNPTQGNLLILGVDMTGDRSLRDYDIEDEDAIEDPLVFLAQPDSLLVSRQFADRNKLEFKSKLTLKTMEGPRQFTVRGIMKAGGLASAFGGNLAVMDIYAAQLIFGRGRMFDRIDVGVAGGVSVDECRRKLEAVLGPGYQVETPGSRGRHFEAVSRGLSITINISSLFALLVGVFIIYNSFGIAITQRRAEIGILRALGATRRQVLGMFLIESAVTGILGSSFGLGLGLLIARGMLPVLSGFVKELYNAPQQPDQIALEPGLLAAAVLIGVAASLLGGLLPARNAARVDPVKALQKGRYQVLAEGENRVRRLLSFALAAAALGCLYLGPADAVFYTGYLLAILSVLLMAPSLALWLACALRPGLSWIRPVEGALAADSLIAAPRRTSATVSALMLSLAMAVAFSGVAGAIQVSVRRWLDNAFNPHLFIAATESISARDFRFPRSLRDELLQMPEIEEIQTVRNARVMVAGKPVMVIAIEIESLARRVRQEVIEGDEREMFRAAAAGQGIIISDNLARIHNIHRGGKLEVLTPTGKHALAVLGSVMDYSDQQGSFLIDSTVFRRHWLDDSINIFRIYLRPGARAGLVREQILTRFGDTRRLFVFTNEVLREYVLRVTEQWFSMTYVQLAVAVLVAMLGIVNTLTVSIIDRRRELGVLQAVGAERAQVRHTVWLEAVAVGCIGLVLGLGLGAINLYYNLDFLGRDAGGLNVDYRYPFGFALFLLPVILGSAFLASLWPAEAAVRASLIESLEYE